MSVAIEERKEGDTVIVFSYEGMILDELGKFFKPDLTEKIEGYVEIEVPWDPEIQFYGPKAGLQKIYIGIFDVILLLDKHLREIKVQVKPYEKFNDFELRVLKLAVKKELISFDKAKHIISLEVMEDFDDVNQNIQSSVAPSRTVRKHITGGGVMVPEDAACFDDEFARWSEDGKETVIPPFVPVEDTFKEVTKDPNGFDDNNGFTEVITQEELRGMNQDFSVDSLSKRYK